MEWVQSNLGEGFLLLPKRYFVLRLIASSVEGDINERVEDVGIHFKGKGTRRWWKKSWKISFTKFQKGITLRMELKNSLGRHWYHLKAMNAKAPSMYSQQVPCFLSSELKSR